jgi:hypothetical protein
MRAPPERPRQALGPPVPPTMGPAPAREAKREPAPPARPMSEREPLRSTAVRAERPMRVTPRVTKLLETRENPTCRRSGRPAPAHRPTQGMEARRLLEQSG